VTVIYLSKDLLLQDQCTIDPLDNKLKISDPLKDNLFFNRFYKNFSHGVQTFPSFPEIAFKLRTAIQNDCGIDEIVKIVHLDLVISAKLINAANSVMYRSVSPVSSCFDAIKRIGLRSTCHMVTAFSMNKLFCCQNPSIHQLIQCCWLQSIKVSSISHTLAQLTQYVDPEEALIAGLLHNIGTLPILTFADRLQGYSFQSADLDLCINEIQGQIGTIVLENWGFSRNLSQVPLQSTNWFTSLTEDLNLNDIVLLAKYHALLESPPGNTELPLLITLPAFQKLNNRSLTPEMSLQILDDAKQQIAETMNFFLS
jgi:HD-like signal output (HDOD) protein